MIKIGDVEINGYAILAPMAGVTNEAYRIIAKEHGAALICCEMVSDKALQHKNKKTLDMLKTSPLEHPLSMQIFGSDVDSMVNAAKMVDEMCDCEIIDINMGCPVNKVAVKANAGSALLKDEDKIYEIVKAVVDNVKKPVTVKIRSGWDKNNINAVRVAKLIEKAGAKAISVHPRTRSQMYTGLSDWSIIKKVKEAVNIPVIGNGDIKSPIDAKKMMDETGCDAVMIGRGALGNPWIFNEINAYLEKGILIDRPSLEEIKNTIKKHADELIRVKSPKLAIMEMRSHTAWYIKGLKNASGIRNSLFKCETKEELFELIDEYFKTLV